MKRKNLALTSVILSSLLLGGCFEPTTKSTGMSISEYEENISSYFETSEEEKDSSVTTEISFSQILSKPNTSSEAKENISPETTTSETPEEKEITISFLGDCTLASMKGEESPGNMINYLNTKDTSYFFEDCMDIIGNDDFTVANCENVFSDYATTEIGKDYSPAFWFRSSTKNAFVFADNSIDAVSLANNHTNDYGEKGLAETKSALEKANVQWGDIDNTIYFEKDGVRIGVICAKFWSSYYVDSIVEKIKEVSESTDIQIVFFHGGTEKVHTPEDWKVEGAHRFVDAGADLVIGGHPHVLQPYEEYNGVSIIYSIGNFCYGGHRHPENRTVIYQQKFTLDSKNDIISSNENIIPYYVYTGDTNNWRPSPIEDETEKNKVLDFLYGVSDSLF